MARSLRLRDLIGADLTTPVDLTRGPVQYDPWHTDGDGPCPAPGCEGSTRPTYEPTDLPIFEFMDCR